VKAIPTFGSHERDWRLPMAKFYGLKNWSDDQLDGVHPAEARRLLTIVQEIELGLFEVEYALADRTIVSRPLG
jgi:hypothetical protein